MNNHNKAVEVLDRLDHSYNYSEGEWPDNETVVQALADNGLIAPDSLPAAPPGPDTSVRS